ncbi:hypothetical protein [Pseudomonas sp. BN415]|uniref:hypothetical protein n=1 Tax=Pseudomonas sp. BN415 TaxID=2567889 RepID=UPI002456D767|nr:hypothetical protein [Pseudomonas sp. BN415]
MLMHKRKTGLLSVVLPLAADCAPAHVHKGFVAGTYMPYAGMASADDYRAVGCFPGAQK